MTDLRLEYMKTKLRKSLTEKDRRKFDIQEEMTELKDAIRQTEYNKRCIDSIKSRK